MTPLRAALGAALILGSAPALATRCDSGTAVLTLPAGERVAIAVELADDDAERARGLMHRESLPEGTGMLFIYPEPQEVWFWMRDTLIPLDMLFFDPAGRLAHIHAGAKPLDETAIPGAPPDDPAPERLMVLEIGGGEAARLGITEGALLSHPALDPAQAAAACY